MDELVDIRAEAVGAGTYLNLGGRAILITAVDVHPKVVDLHTEYGPALRFRRGEWVAVVAAADVTADLIAAA